MKIIVFSDSHGCTELMRDAVLLYSPDMIVHLGDHIWDAQCFEEFPIPVRSVRGNCDFSSTATVTDTVIGPGGVKIVLTHGHIYGVKMGLSGLLDMGSSAGADILLFGHTHAPLCEHRDGMLLLNPGSAGLGREKTCGLIQIDAGEISCEIASILK